MGPLQPPFPALDWITAKSDIASARVLRDSSDNTIPNRDRGWSGRPRLTLTSDLFSSSVVIQGGGEFEDQL